MRSKGFHNVAEVAPGDVLSYRGVTIRATMAVHSGKREPRGPVALAIGYVIEAGPATLYFAGDTDIFPGMADLVPGELDVAMIPVWGWGLVLGDGHLNPQSAADAVALAEAALRSADPLGDACRCRPAPAALCPDGNASPRVREGGQCPRDRYRGADHPTG